MSAPTQTEESPHITAAARDLATAIMSAESALTDAAENFEAARALAATYHWVAMALTCSDLRDQVHCVLRRVESV